MNGRQTAIGDLHDIDQGERLLIIKAAIFEVSVLWMNSLVLTGVRLVDRQRFSFIVRVRLVYGVVDFWENFLLSDVQLVLCSFPSL